MAIAGAEMALGSRLMVEVTLDLIRGYRPLRNEKPRMGVRGWFGGGGGGWDDWPTTTLGMVRQGGIERVRQTWRRLGDRRSCPRGRLGPISGA